MLRAISWPRAILLAFWLSWTVCSAFEAIGGAASWPGRLASFVFVMILGLIPFGIVLGLVGLIAKLVRLITMSGRAIKDASFRIADIFAFLSRLWRPSTKQR